MNFVPRSEIRNAEVSANTPASVASASASPEPALAQAFRSIRNWRSNAPALTESSVDPGAPEAGFVSATSAPTSRKSRWTWRTRLPTPTQPRIDPGDPEVARIPVITAHVSAKSVWNWKSKAHASLQRKPGTESVPSSISASAGNSGFEAAPTSGKFVWNWKSKAPTSLQTRLGTESAPSSRLARAGSLHPETNPGLCGRLCSRLQLCISIVLPTCRGRRQRPISYEHFSASKNVFWSALNALLMIWFHVVRSTEPMTTPPEGATGQSADIASTREKQRLEELYPSTGGKPNLKKCMQISNYIVWRRSAMFILLPLHIWLAVLACSEIPTGIKDYENTKKLASTEVSIRWEQQFERYLNNRNEPKLRLGWNKHLSLKDGVLDYFNRTKAGVLSLRNAYDDDALIITAWFNEYSVGVFKQIWYELMVAIKLGQVIRECVVASIWILVVLCVARAMTTWAKWTNSRLWLKLAWFMSFLIPFLGSAVPVQLLLRNGQIERYLAIYIEDTRQFFFRDLLDLHLKHLNDAINNIDDMFDMGLTAASEFEEHCDKIPTLKNQVDSLKPMVDDMRSDLRSITNSVTDMETSAHEAKGSMDSTCTLTRTVNKWLGWLSKAPGRATVACRSATGAFGEMHQKFPAIKDSMSSMGGYMDTLLAEFDGVEDKIDDFHEMCLNKALEAKTLITKTRQSFHHDGLGRVREEVRKIESETYRHEPSVLISAKYVSKLTIGTLNAFGSAAAMWTICIALAPGLLQGALAAKLVVPESAVPGIFVLMMPWFYTPIVWTLYSMISHIIGNWQLYVGFWFFAVYPMGYVVFGFYYRLSLPMNLSTYVAVKERVDMMKHIFMLTGLAFMIWGGVTIYVEMRPVFDQVREVLELPSGDQELSDVFWDLFKVRLSTMVSAPSFIMCVIVSTIAKLYMTSVVGADVMIKITAEQRAAETSGSLGAISARRLGSLAQKTFAEVKKDAASRERNLDVLVYLLDSQEMADRKEEHRLKHRNGNSTNADEPTFEI